MLRLLLLVVPIAALAACQTPSPNYCPDDAGMCGSPGDGSSGGHCSSDSDCKTAEFPACDLTSNQCKPCTENNPGVCMGTSMPHCDSNACAPCVDDKDCSNGAGVCLATGDCALPGQIIHADSTKGGTSNCGDAATPCSLTGALGLVTPGKNVIKLDDAGPFVANGFMVTNDVTIDARGATLNRGDGGPIITVMGGKSLTLLGGTIQGAHGGMGSGIQCNGATLTVASTGAAPATQATIIMNEQFGIDATNCTLSLTKTKIEKNGSTGIRVSGGSIALVRSWLDTNNGGGADINNGARFTIVGNVFVNNGTAGGQIGGIGISTSATGNRLDFNSIAENKTQAGMSAGVTCAANPGFVAKNNIVWSNNSNVPANAGIQVFGGCGHSYSDIGPLGITGPSDIGSNQNKDPKFKDQTSDLHLTSMSPLQNLQQADPGINPSDSKDPAAKDIDGDSRASPVNIGADQVPAAP